MEKKPRTSLFLLLPLLWSKHLCVYFVPFPLIDPSSHILCLLVHWLLGKILGSKSGWHDNDLWLKHSFVSVFPFITFPSYISVVIYFAFLNSVYI